MAVIILHENCFLTRQVRIFACFILRVQIRDRALDIILRYVHVILVSGIFLLLEVVWRTLICHNKNLLSVFKECSCE